MSKKYSENDQVSWKWGQGTAEGKISEIYYSKKTVSIDGNNISKDGTKQNPALLIKQEDGQRVLKLASEIEKSN